MLTHLYEIVRQRAERQPTATAVGGQQGLMWKTLDSRELLALVDGLATELEDCLNIAPGDRVVLWAPNSWRSPVYLFALWKLGAVVVPFDHEMNPDTAASILQSVEPRGILAGYGERPAWAVGHPGLAEWWEPRTPEGTSASHISTWTRPAEGLAALYFTSGTTGNPKGCMITHDNLCTQVRVFPDIVPIDPTCRLGSLLPLSHLFELTVGLLYPMAVGAAVHYIPSRRAPDVLRVLQEQRVTHMVAVPQLLAVMSKGLDNQLRAKLPSPLYRALNAAADRLPMSGRRLLFWTVHRKLGGHLRLMVSGGAALPPETQRQWERLGIRVIQGYGTSECSPVVSGGLADGSTPVGSVGKPIPGVEVRLSPEGELLVRGPNVMRGYWRDPKRTAEVLQEGWYHTGDVAIMDADGNLWLQGRVRELIVLPSGMKVWPQDVEEVLRSHPAVKDAAVIAVPGGSGMKLHAYLIPNQPEDREVDLRAIVALANGRLALHQRIATASWWQSETGDFPRTALLKVRRHLLPLPREAAEVESTLAADDPVAQAIAGSARVGSVQAGQTLAELGIDSLGLVDLALLLEEKTGKTVADGDLQLEMTVEQVRSLVAGLPDRVEAEGASGQATEGGAVALWPYTWGRAFRFLSLPFSLLYHFGVTRTIILGAEHLEGLPPRVIFAGTHRSYPDLLLLKTALSRSAARGLASRLVVPAAATRLAEAGPLAPVGTLLFGIYRLDQYSGRDASLRGLVRLAEAGNAVVIFPQGRQVSAESELARAPNARFKPGVAHLAAALGASVIPFGLAGTESIVPPTPPAGFQGPAIAGIPLSLQRHPLAIAFGPPLALGQGEGVRDFAQRLEAVCFGLARQAEQALAAPSQQEQVFK